MADYIPPPVEIKTWLGYLANTSPRVASMNWVHEIAVLCAKLRQCDRREPANDDLGAKDTESLVAEAINLDKQLESWYRNLPVEWSQLKKPLKFDRRPEWTTRLLKQPGAPTAVYDHPNAVVALELNVFRASRLHLHLTLFNLVSRKSPPEQDARLITRMLGLIDVICATIPATLQITASGEGDPQSPLDVYGQRGHHLLWPLLSCQRCFQREECASLDKAQRKDWISVIAGFVSNELGYANIPPNLINSTA
jgi:hypothetical protein